MSFDYTRNLSLVRGPVNATLTSVGDYRYTAPGERRVIPFDLILVDLVGEAPTRLGIGRFPRLNRVFFEIRPDLPYSLISADRWHYNRRRYSVGLPGQTLRIPGIPQRCPDYPAAQTWQGGRRAAQWGGYRLVQIQVAIMSPNLDWGFRIPVFDLALCNSLPMNVCCLGRDFLSNGLACHQTDYTYFFAPRADQEVWANMDRFRTPTVLTIPFPDPPTPTTWV